MNNGTESGVQWVDELHSNGYAVVPNVLTREECQQYINEYMEWVQTFQDEMGYWPSNMKSIIQKYRIGHFSATWNVRLKAKPVFQKIWGTEKLLTSVDGVSIGRPPEDGETDFATESSVHWLHTDQSVDRQGLHCYQAGVNLEEVTCEDWSFEVLEKSHLLHADLFKAFPEAAKKSRFMNHYDLGDENVKWFEDQGCTRKRVEVPQGGMVLWDSRTIHQNAPAKKGRKNPGRWRYVVFVCMLPAAWADQEDMQLKKEAYAGMQMTTHWPAMGVNLFPNSKVPSPNIKELPAVARSRDVRLLAGDTNYDFNDGKPNGPRKPQFEQDWSPRTWCSIM